MFPTTMWVGGVMKRIIPIIPISIAILLTGISIHPLPSQEDFSPPPSETTPGTSRKIQGVVKPGETMFDIFQKNGLNLRDLFRLREASAGCGTSPRDNRTRSNWGGTTASFPPPTS